MIVVAALAVAATGCGDGDESATCPSGGCEITTVDGVEYTDDKLLNIIEPVPPGPWPVVVTAHGHLSDRVSMTDLAEAIARRGAVVFNPTLPDEPPFLDTTEHLACAVRFARATADEHGGDPQRITLVGHSMGAYTGSLVALDGGEYVDQTCAVADGSTTVDALVGYEGPYDQALNHSYPFDLWALEESDPALWSAIDPYQHLGGNPDLVVRLIQGVDEDSTQFDIRPEVSEAFGQALADAGYDVDVIMVDGANHSYGRPGLPQWEELVDQAMDVAGPVD